MRYTLTRVGGTVGVAFLSVAVVLPPSPVVAAQITPTVFTDDFANNGNCSLREAIWAANNDGMPRDQCAQGSGADTIQLQSGTYSLTIQGDMENDAQQGDLDVISDLTIQGAGAVIDGNWLTDPDRIFEIANAGPDLTLADLTVRDGELDGFEDGGGVLVPAMATLTATEVRFESNVADESGGGIRNGGTVTMVGGALVDNHADAANGGALYNAGTATLRDVVVSGNSTTSANGGGIHTVGTFAAENVLFAQNEAPVNGHGGAVAAGAGTATLTNVTVTDNEAGIDGGGLYNSTGTLNVNSATVTKNTSDSNNNFGGDGGGIYRGSGTVNVRNTIVAGNTTGTTGASPDCGGGITSQGHNLVQDPTGCSGLGASGDITGQDPKLGPLADNGGPMPTHALLSGSPAIDKGGADCPATDQRGVPRSACDIGAYELVLCLGTVVNRVGTSGPDTLVGTAGNDGILAGDGADVISGEGGADAVCAEAGNDRAAGGPGNDELAAGAGNDRVSGQGGKDRLLGDVGRDRLNGGGGRDRLKGGPGKDTCVGGGGKDKVNCETERGV